MRWLGWTAVGLLGILLLIVATLAWMLGSHSGTVAAIELAQRALAGSLAIERVEGTLAGPLTLHNVEFAPPAGGTTFSARRIHADVQLLDLLRWTAHVNTADVRGVRVNIRPSPEPEPPPEPFTLQPPIELVVDRFTASDVRILNRDEHAVHVTKAAFAGSWTDLGVAVKQLDVRSPDGEVHFTANVRQERVYLGDGRGSFRWRLGERVVRGTLDARAEGEDARLELRLSQPVRARLQAAVKQTEALPWRFDLNVPTFDPRGELLPDSNLQSLGAALEGAGSLQAGRVSGRLLIDGETLHLQPLQFARTEQQLDLDGTLRINDAPGALQVDGQIATRKDPPVADVTLDWKDLVVPERWAGQVLHTRGELRFNGNTQRFATQGSITVGPPERLATIELRADGTPQAMRLQQFDIVQPNGRLAANGTVELEPKLAWNAKAQATRFDPGAFAASWPGQLDFALASTGQVTDAGPSLQLKLQQLEGQLRGRKLAGSADLQVTPDKVLAGRLDLRSGASRVHVEGQSGDTMDAAIALDIASLNDWLPDASGRIEGHYSITGRWPQWRIVGTTSANDVHAMDVRIATLALDIDVTNPTDPSGRARLDATDLAAGGFEFAQLNTQIAGSRESHRLAFDARGEPLDTELAVQGGLEGETWNGTLDALMLDIEGAAHLTLREPARVSYSPTGTSISNTCLRDGSIELCAAAALDADGSLQARYSLRDVPLALANVLAPSLPLAFTGTLQGEGEIRRDVEGALFGRATISSPNGQLAQRSSDTSEEQRPLLRYADLRIAATLSGPDAQASLHAQLEDRGNIDGSLTVNGLNEALTPIRGEVAAALPSLAPIAVFVPQLASLSGSVDTRIGIAGTVQEPQLSGYVRANDVAAGVPALGLQLREGRLEAVPREDGAIQLSGGIRSGDGDIQLDGTATREGTLQVQVSGKRFLAADIPSAEVTIDPALTFERTSDAMRLQGEVTVRKAKVNLQKLPRGGTKAPQASSDVVIIDEQSTQDEVASLPLEAKITVILSDKVQITGFGLDAQVQGRLDVRESPGQPTTGSGEIRIAGQYKAYGQDLTIQQGQVLYASTPIDNPRLNIVAVREIEADDVTAGLRITGTAQAPQLSVFSDPAMGESNALAYLVTGRPLDQVGAGDEGDGDMLQTAARSLGTAAGGLLAKNIGNRLGVDEVSITESEALNGGTAFTVGEYLSPRLFLSYGVGLFEPGEVITLRYKLSRDLALQAERGPQDTRAGVEYRIER